MVLVGQHLIDFSLSLIDHPSRGEQLGILDPSPGIAVVFEHALPIQESGVHFAEGRLGLSQGHECVAKIVSRVGLQNLLQEGLGLGGFALSQEALPQMANGVVILWIPLQGPTVRRFGLGQFALREIKIC